MLRTIGYVTIRKGAEKIDSETIWIFGFLFFLMFSIFVLWQIRIYMCKKLREENIKLKEENKRLKESMVIKNG